MVIYNADGTDSQRFPVISIAAAAVSHGSKSKTNIDLIDQVTYEGLASVIR